MARTGVLQVLDYLLKDGSQTERKRYDSTQIATCMLCFSAIVVVVCSMHLGCSDVSTA